MFKKYQGVAEFYGASSADRLLTERAITAQIEDFIVNPKICSHFNGQQSHTATGGDA